MTGLRPPAPAHINAVATAVPGHDVHEAFVNWATEQIDDSRRRALFRRMAERSGIGHRWSVLPAAPGGGSPVCPGGFYHGDPPPTSARMRIYAAEAPRLALAAIDKLGDLGEVTHLVVASCTGFVAPGVDQLIAAELGLGSHVERTLVGFMGCYAAVAALRVAHHLVRSEPGARVLVVTVELSTLHLQPAREIEPLLAMLQFGDGAAAAIVSAEPRGLEISCPFATTLAGSSELITWVIGDTGFAMHLSGEVPQRIAGALRDPALLERVLDGAEPHHVSRWAVHAGGRSILEAVEGALALPRDALQPSRAVLADFGNMSSSTLMFVLQKLLAEPAPGPGVAVAFGPGLAAEGFRFRSAA